MSAEHIHNDGSDSDHEEHIGVQHNPNGPWANLEDTALQDAILREAGECHKQCALDNPKLSKFADFLDAFASAWLEQKAKVEEEGKKYGFAPCEDTALLSEEDRRKAALLCLTLYGSYVLLGNGCLTNGGGSGRYEKIPFRKGGMATIKTAPHSVTVDGEARLQELLKIVDRPIQFIGNTSSLQMLLTTTENLPEEDKLRLGEALSESCVDLINTIRGDIDETIIVEVPLGKPDRGNEFPNDAPLEVPKPELEPMC
ncbi:MAG: hypothetical protein QF741_04385 [Candidatus Peribacteraceae bacterium]|jgi:hypothetical protein|nr:hypothetical protein [Candidatus Peribacteraceae bacterium]MDP7454734.1 hypothetical protein [Candidatus Peribacteraceae bacterium]